MSIFISPKNYVFCDNKDDIKKIDFVLFKEKHTVWCKTQYVNHIIDIVGQLNKDKTKSDNTDNIVLCLEKIIELQNENNEIKKNISKVSDMKTNSLFNTINDDKYSFEEIKRNILEILNKIIKNSDKIL